MIRVAQIIGKWVGGGVESVVLNYYRAIDKSAVQFDFIIDEDSLLDVPTEEIEKMGGRVIYIPPYQKIIKYHKRLKEVLKEGNYTIVHSHINTLSFFSLWAAKKAKIPVRIAHSHSTTNRKEFKRNLLKQLLRPLSKIFATHYMCCSEVAGRWLFGNKAFDNGHVYVLNNAIDLKKYTYDDEVRKKTRNELNINDNNIVIGHVGRFVATKNQLFLIEVFNKVYGINNKYRLVLVGRGPMEEQIRERVHELQLDDVVMLLGQRNDVNRLYQAFDIFTLPSLYEGLGLVLIEAQASGLDCIASTEVPTQVKLIPEVYFMSINEKNSITDWANDIIRITPSKRRNCEKELRNSNYSLEDEAMKLKEKYIELYNDSLGDRKDAR